VSTPEQIISGSPSNQPPTAAAKGGGAGTGGSAKPVRSESTAGILFGIGAYGLWGLLPLYFFILMPAGAIEIVAGLGVAFKPRIFAYVVAAWLLGIICNLLAIPGYFDVALRDVGLMLGALALGRLSQRFD